MTLVLRNRTPLHASLRRVALDDSFERLMHGLFAADAATASPAATTAASVAPQTLAIDVRETDAAYEVEADLPGLRKEEISISIDAGRVTITAESAQKRADAEGEKLIHAERTLRKFSRSFSLPAELDEARIDARLENGVLTLTLPKKPLVQPKQVIVR